MQVHMGDERSAVDKLRSKHRGKMSRKLGFKIQMDIGE